jgi:hypothetical protein
VNHEQDRRNLWLTPNRSNRVPPLLCSHRIDAIRSDEAKFVFEDQRSHFE